MGTSTSIECLYPDPTCPLVSLTSNCYRHPPHIHHDLSWEFSYMAKGAATTYLGQGLCRLGPGEALLTPPTEVHGLYSRLGKRIVTMFQEPVLQDTPLGEQAGPAALRQAFDRSTPRPIRIAPQRRAAFEHTLLLLQQESQSNEPMKYSMCVILLSRLLMELLQACQEPVTPDEELASPSARQMIEQFCGELRAHLDHPWTLEEMTRRSGYSARQLHRLFRQVTALSPYRWLVEERLRRAEELLAHTDASVGVIAVEVGFGSRSQLHRAFQSSLGVSPNQFRETVGLRTQRPDSQQTWR